MTKMTVMTKNDIGPEYSFLDYFSYLFEGLRKNSYAAFFYSLIHILRRIVFVYIAMHLAEHFVAQTIGFVLQSLVVAVLIFLIEPFQCPATNRVEAFNEILILIIGYHMFIVAGFIVPSDSKFGVGVSAIVFICVLIAVNIFRWARIMGIEIKL